MGHYFLDTQYKRSPFYEHNIQDGVYKVAKTTSECKIQNDRMTVWHCVSQPITQGQGPAVPGGILEF